MIAPELLGLQYLKRVIQNKMLGSMLVTSFGLIVPSLCFVPVLQYLHLEKTYLYVTTPFLDDSNSERFFSVLESTYMLLHILLSLAIMNG